MSTGHLSEHESSRAGTAKDEKTSAPRPRLVLYAIAFPAAVVVDFFTPLGVADWLTEVTLVCIASVWGQTREILVVAAIATAAILVGLLSSPDPFVPFWMALLNRLAAIFVIWVIFELARRRLAAEKARRQAIAEIKVLQGLLPMCSVCKAIRNPAGEWQKVEVYLSAHSEARLTHGLCPPCAKKYMDEWNASAPGPPWFS